ncbi:MAG: PRC-barrel domain protein [Thermoanaerobacterales bacterium 50_218]|nr:MAG: PRC-barrel domain protein [Thermoanaerobacterales bacterium 50_218]
MAVVVKISELRVRDVINVLDGKRLGTIKDIEIDLEAGRVRALVLPGNSRFLSFLARNEEVIVPWEKIVKIGIDVILVEVNPSH